MMTNLYGVNITVNQCASQIVIPLECPQILN
jgi:hypothetical protein